MADKRIFARQIGVLCGALFCAVFASAATRAADADRYVRDGVLVSREDPRLAMSVDHAFVFAGRHPIRIDDIAAGERFVFVDADDRLIHRLIIVQFEGFLPGVNEEYRYNLTGKPVVAAYPFRSNGFAFDFPAAAAENPTRESAFTKTFLDEQGYKAPAEWMMWRSLTVADVPRRKEVIIFYVEDVAATGLTLDDLYQGDSATQDWIDIQKQLEIRANQSFRLTTLNADDMPDAAGWSSIPNTFMN